MGGSLTAAGKREASIHALHPHLWCLHMRLSASQAHSLPSHKPDTQPPLCLQLEALSLCAMERNGVFVFGLDSIPDTWQQLTCLTALELRYMPHV